VSIAEQEDNEKDKEVMSINLAEIEKQSADILADLGEIAIDSFLKNGPIKDIPIFGSALKGIQGYKAIRDYFFIQKLYEFVRNPSTIDPEKRQQFRDKMAKDRNFAKRTAMHLTVVLDRLDELEKAALFAKIFSAYINGIIAQQQMKRLASALDRALFADIIALKNFIIDNHPLNRDNFYGIEGVGLASVYHSITRPLEPDDVHGQIDELHFVVNPTAVQLIKIMF
jgi:hypothetical protein